MSFHRSISLAVLPDVHRVPGLQRHPLRAGGVASAPSLFTDPTLVAPMFHRPLHGQDGRLVKNYFPVFLLGPSSARSSNCPGFEIHRLVGHQKLVGAERAISPSCWCARCSPTAACRCSWWCFRGVSLRAEMFRQGGIPKRLIPGTIALGAFSRSRWIPCPARRRSRTSSRPIFFKTNIYAAPVLGVIGRSSSSCSAWPTWNGVAAPGCRGR